MLHNLVAFQNAEFYCGQVGLPCVIGWHMGRWQVGGAQLSPEKPVHVSFSLPCTTLFLRPAAIMGCL